MTEIRQGVKFARVIAIEDSTPVEMLPDLVLESSLGLR
jgi:hypothetical protein